MRLYDYLMTHWPQQQEKFWNVDGDDMSVVKDGMGDGHPSSERECRGGGVRSSDT